MITPQETAQYGQMLRVSVVCAILSSRISAWARLRSKPKSRPTTAAPPPPAKTLRKVRRSILGHLPGIERNHPWNERDVKQPTVPWSFFLEELGSGRGSRVWARIRPG